MSLFHSDNEKEEKHSGILGAFSVDNIKWEPGNDEDASLVSFRYPYEDFPNGSYLQVAQSQIAVFTNNMGAGSSTDATGAGDSRVACLSVRARSSSTRETADSPRSAMPPIRLPAVARRFIPLCTLSILTT